MARDKKTGLTDKQRIFCHEYCRNGWNGTQAAIKAGYSKDTSGVIAMENLKKPYIQEYIEKVKNNFELLCGISKAKVLAEHHKLAFSSIAHMHDTWIKRKEFESLTDDQRDCISEIDTKIKTEYEYNPTTEQKEPISVEYIHIKLYDKQKALDSITKMLGYNPTEKIDITTQGEKINRDYTIEELRERVRLKRELSGDAE
jgi:phage terminase small subunit